MGARAAAAHPRRSAHRARALLRQLRRRSRAARAASSRAARSTKRLRREALGNVAISVVESDRPETFLVAGRGELQLGS